MSARATSEYFPYLFERPVCTRTKRVRQGGVIAVDRDGNFVMTYNTEGMVRGVTTNDMEPVVKVF